MTNITQALVVDDSKSARYSLKKMLVKQGIDTIFAESAGTALNLLETQKPDVIFMDHLMPGMDGFEATKAIKSNPLTTAIPIVMCTSREGIAYEDEARRNGATAILPKPAPEDVLTHILSELSTAVTDTPAEITPQPTPISKEDIQQQIQGYVQQHQKECADELGSILETRLTQHIGQQFEEYQKEQQQSNEIRTAKMEKQLLGTLASESDDKIKHTVRQLLAEHKTDEELIEQISTQLQSKLKAQLSEEFAKALSQQEKTLMESAHNAQAQLTQTAARAQMVAAAGIAIGLSALIATLVL